MFPARSVCEIVIVFAPSPLEKNKFCEKLEPEHRELLLVNAPKSPVPEKEMGRPFSQLPVAVIWVWLEVLAAGLFQAMTGARVSLTQDRLDTVVVFPAPSV